jgi:hypothetical protein
MITDFPPCPIASEAQLEATQQQINRLILCEVDYSNPNCRALLNNTKYPSLLSLIGFDRKSLVAVHTPQF